MNKELSRQRKWQIKKTKIGRCQICGEKEVVKQFCEKHRKMRNERDRKYQKIKTAKKSGNKNNNQLLTPVNNNYD